jgi:hypothetical protein
MKEIPLTKGKSAIVDDCDFEYYSKFNYYINSEGYAIREVWNGGNKIRLRMHREITNAPEGMDVDHINGDRVDNRRENLRLCTRSENLMNSRKRDNKSSKYKGVSFFKPVKMWRAYYQLNGRQKTIGYFRDEICAALAYNEAAIATYGEFARLNVVEAQ